MYPMPPWNCTQSYMTWLMTSAPHALAPDIALTLSWLTSCIQAAWYIDARTASTLAWFIAMR